MRALIICAAPETELEYLKKAAKEADKIICADGGIRYALKCGIRPDLIVGDFDSFKGELPDAPTVKLNCHKDDTDTVSCIKQAIKLGCDTITIACAVGGRIDHTIANISALSLITDGGAGGKIITPREQIKLLTEGSYIFENLQGRTFSVFPFGESCTVSYKNAEYPLDRYEMNVSYPIGISNVFTKDLAEITIHSGRAILIINEVL